MRIYLDESKRLGEGKMVLGGFVTYHAHGYIEKYMYLKKLEYGMNDTIEIKGSRSSGSYFYHRMIQDNCFDIIKSNIIGIHIDECFKDDIEIYKKTLGNLIYQCNDMISNYRKKIYIIADNQKFGKNMRTVERQIEIYLNEMFDTPKGIIFNFKNSYNNLSIQLSDILVYKLGKAYFFGEYLDDFMIDNFFIKTHKIFVKKA